MAIVGRVSQNASFRRARWASYAVMILFTAYCFIPLFYLVVSATKTEVDLFTTFGLWFGSELNIADNLREMVAFQDGVYLKWMWNSAWYSVTSALGATAFGAAAGYAFAKFQFPGKKVCFAIILGAVMVPGTALVVPIFLMMTNAGIVNTPAAVILPSMVFPLGVYLMRIYTEQGVPTELIEAARIDGAGEFRIFLSVALRLLAPGLVTVLLLSFVSTWNNYFLPLVVLTSPKYFPLTVGLSNWYATAHAPNSTGPAFTVVMTGALAGVIPIIIAFLTLQRYWRAGLTAGGVK